MKALLEIRDLESCILLPNSKKIPKRRHIAILHSSTYFAIMVFQRARVRSSTSSVLSGMMNVTIAAGVGFVSGYYIFKEPLEAYWREQRKLEQPTAESSAVKDPPVPKTGVTSPAVVTPSTATKQ